MFQGPPCVSLCRLPPRYDQSNVTTSKMHQRCYPSWVWYLYLHERWIFMVNVGKLIYHTWILWVAYLAPENWWFWKLLSFWEGLLSKLLQLVSGSVFFGYVTTSYWCKHVVCMCMNGVLLKDQHKRHSENAKEVISNIKFFFKHQIFWKEAERPKLSMVNTLTSLSQQTSFRSVADARHPGVLLRS